MYISKIQEQCLAIVQLEANINPILLWQQTLLKWRPNIKLIKDIQLNNGDKCDVEEWGRYGTLSPKTHIFLYKGRRIVPYEQRLKGISVSLNGLFKLVYGEALAKLIPPVRNPFLNLISKGRL